MILIYVGLLVAALFALDIIQKNRIPFQDFFLDLIGIYVVVSVAILTVVNEFKPLKPLVY